MAANLDTLIGKSIGNKTIDPSGESSTTKKLLAPNAKDDPRCLPGEDNVQEPFIGGKGKPSPPYGPAGRGF
jgi:hypothetical protein